MYLLCLKHLLSLCLPRRWIRVRHRHCQSEIILISLLLLIKDLFQLLQGVGGEGGGAALDAGVVIDVIVDAPLVSPGTLGAGVEGELKVGKYWRCKRLIFGAE